MLKNKSSEAKGSVALRGGGESATVAGVLRVLGILATTLTVCVHFPSMELCLDVS